MSRAKWKGPYVAQKQLNDINKSKNKMKTKLISRKSEIIPKFVGKTFTIHNGKDFFELNVTEEMIGHKFGEFFPTRKRFSYKKK